MAIESFFPKVIRNLKLESSFISVIVQLTFIETRQFEQAFNLKKKKLKKKDVTSGPPNFPEIVYLRY